MGVLLLGMVDIRISAVLKVAPLALAVRMRIAPWGLGHGAARWEWVGVVGSASR